MGTADLHIHSLHSDGMAAVPEILAYAEGETDLDVVAIADHDQIRGALEAVEWCAGRPESRLQAVVGTEISAAWGRHLLALFFSEPYPTSPFPRFRSLRSTVAMVHDAGGVVVVPHPLSPLVPSVGERAMRALLAHRPPGLVGVELCSSVIGGRRTEARIKHLNRTVWHLAALGNSDAHHLVQLGSAYTSFPGNSLKDVFRALHNRTTEASWGSTYHIPVRRHLQQNWRSLVLKPIRELREAMTKR